MSYVNPSDTHRIESRDEILQLYQGAGGDIRAGIEVEMGFFDAESPDLKPMNRAQNEAAKARSVKVCGESCIHPEPSADMMEVASIAEGMEGFPAVLEDINRKIGFLTEIAAQTGLKRAYFQEQPHVTAAQLFPEVLNVPRYQAFFAPPRADMVDIAAYFFVCKSNQVSVSYRDPGHMLENIRRLYYLAPFLFLLTENASGFNEGKAFTGHGGMHHRASLKARGGVPDYVFTAKTGQDYIAAHIDNIMNNPLYVYYDEKGDLVRIPSGEWSSFNALRERGLNTATNYFLAQSVLWPDVKIAPLRDDVGNVHGHRFEARMMGVGIHQHQSAFLIVAGLALNEAFAAGTDRLLAEYGFDPGKPEETRRHVMAAYEAARNHDNRFFDVAYGTGTMREFARRFADLLEQAWAGQGYEDALRPILYIARSGWTDTKVNRFVLNTMDKTKDWLRDYDPAVFFDPNNCAAFLFEKELKRASAA